MRCDAQPVVKIQSITRRKYQTKKKSKLSDRLRRRGSRILRRLINNPQLLRRRLPKNRRYRRKVARQERTVANQVVVHVAADGSHVVGEVDVGAGDDHGNGG